MKITTAKIKGGACTSIGGRIEYPDYYEASIYYSDGIGGSIHFYADAPTRSEAIKALKVKLADIVKMLESVK